MAQFRNDIQGIRGLAVISVILFHANPDFFKSGYLGVDVFFVVSGYVVAPLLLRITDQNNQASQYPKKIIDFWIKRSYRLLPALGFTLSISTIFLLLLIKPSDLERIANQGIASMFSFGNFGALKFNTNYFWSEPNPYLHTWSLSVEEQIYLLIPPLLVMNKKLNGSRISESKFFGILTGISFTIALLVPLNRGAIAWIEMQNLTALAFYSPLTRFWEFGVGAIAFCNAERFPNWIRSIRKKNVNRSLLIVLLILLLLPFHLEYGVLAESIACLLTILLIISGSQDLQSPNLLNLFKWMGDRSYSLYLIHMPAIHIAKFSPVFENVFSSKIRVLIAFFVTLVLGNSVYKHIENRYRINSGTEVSAISVPKLFACFWAFPLVLLIVISFGSRTNLFGLNQNLKQPPYAGDLDKDCNRTSEDGRPCIYPIKGSNSRILLIGDSHAFHLSQAVIDAANAEQIETVIWKNMACIISIPDSQSNACKNRLSKLTTYLASNEVDFTFISFYIKSTSDQKSLRKLISDVSGKSKRTIVLGQTPVFPDEKDFFVSRPIVMNTYVAPTEFPIDQMNLSTFDAARDLENWVISSGLDLLNTRSLFCDDKTCKRYENSQWLFRDDDHLSVDGAKKLIPMFRGVLSESQ